LNKSEKKKLLFAASIIAATVACCRSMIYPCFRFPEATPMVHRAGEFSREAEDDRLAYCICRFDI
jgi:hypothetical protein